MVRSLLPLVALITYLCHGGQCEPQCDDPGEPLILTPLLNTGDYRQAQDQARVVPDIEGVKSYTGYFTVNEKCDSNLFFWFVPAQNSWETAPVVLWLNGGPGCTSMFGALLEVGPWKYSRENDTLYKNPYPWTVDHNVIFLDQPAGTGFSFTGKGCYVTELDTLSREAYTALQQFFMLFPNLKQNRFFITGESYAGHYIPAIASEIHRRNKVEKTKINMIGYMIGNPWLETDCNNVADYLYENGIIDYKLYENQKYLEESRNKELAKKNYTGAEHYMSLMDNNGVFDDKFLPNTYNILTDEDPSDDWQLYLRYFKRRKHLHVGKTPFSVCSSEVGKHMNDTYTAMRPLITELLDSEQYVLGFYSGNLDVVCLYTSTECVLQSLEWKGRQQYLAAHQAAWYSQGRLAGWVKAVANLFLVVVRGAGHMVPVFQGAAMQDLLRAFTASQPNNQLLSGLHYEPPDY